MAIIGWLACLFFVVYLSVGAGLVALNNLGTYNIGGAVNSFASKFWSFIMLAIIAYLWYLIFTCAPFTINLS